jgi:hypothetical protein
MKSEDTWGLVIKGELHAIAVQQARGQYRAGNGGECPYGWGVYPDDAMADLCRGEGIALTAILDPEAVTIWLAAERQAERPARYAGDASMTGYPTDLAALRVALADADLIMEQRERQLTAALTALADERARCATVCREVSRFYAAGDVGSVVALACADEIEREPLDIQTIAK